MPCRDRWRNPSCTSPRRCTTAKFAAVDRHAVAQTPGFSASKGNHRILRGARLRPDQGHLRREPGPALVPGSFASAPWRPARGYKAAALVHNEPGAEPAVPEAADLVASAAFGGGGAAADAHAMHGGIVVDDLGARGPADGPGLERLTFTRSPTR